MTMRKWKMLLLLSGLLFTACGLVQPAPPAPATAVPQPTEPPTPTAEPAPVEEVVVQDGTAVNAPPFSTVNVNDAGPDFASLGDGWTKVEPGGDTRCAHDTPFAYWVRQGTINKLLVYFEGGGGCWDASTCRRGSNFYDGDVGPDEDPTRRSGILEMDNPDNPFKDYHAVYIPSCNGDIYWGNSVQNYPRSSGGTLEIYHRGFVNAAAALDWAYANVPGPESIFVTGCSAGSVGSRVHTPYIIEQFPGTPVTQLGDSLSFVFGEPVNLEGYNAYATFPDWIPGLQSLIQPGGFLMADYDATIAGEYPEMTFAQYNTENDNVQVRFYTAVNPQDEEQFSADLATHLSTIHAEAPNFRSYTAAGELHCVLPRREFYEMESGGVPLLEWVGSLAAGRDVDNVQCEDCQVDFGSGAGSASSDTTAPVAAGWQQVGTMMTPRSENRGVVIGDKFYIPGGWGGESVLEAYEPGTDRWERLADLPDGRHHFMTAAVRDKLYLFGGSTAGAYQPTDTAWVYDPATDSWADIAPLPDARMGGAAVAIGPDIYIIGGIVDGATQPTLRYDIGADLYEELAPMNQPREHIGAAVIDGQIYVAGGWWQGSGELTSMEIYDPTSDTWQDGPPMSVPRGGLALAAVGDNLYVAGGEILSSGRRTENRIELYDSERRTWTQAPPLPEPVHGFPLLVYDGSLWVIGGSDRAGASLNQGRVLRLAVP